MKYNEYTHYSSNNFAQLILFKSKIVVSIAKIACDVFGLPDLYTYMIARNNYFKSYIVIFSHFFTDIFLNFNLGTSFIIDFGAYSLWKFLKRKITLIKFKISLYLIRYYLLYNLGLAFANILNQIYCGIFFIIAVKFWKQKNIYIDFK